MGELLRVRSASRVRPARALALLALMLAMTPGTAAQGPSPLDDAAYADAIAAGRRGEPPGNDPFVMRLTRVRDAETLDLIEDAPFSFYVHTPYSTVSELAAAAAASAAPVHVPTKDEANAQLVTIEVTPGRIAETADAIFHVVLRRGGREFRPVTVRVVPELVEDRDGGRRLLTAGSFAFPFQAFTPDEPLTIILVGRRTSFEWTLTRDELRALR